MLGAIIGDIVGSRFEFDETPHQDFHLFLDKPRCDYTDDTVMTMAIADAILHGKDYGQTMREWGQRYPNPKGGYGNYFQQWLFTPDMPANNSCGNGAAMRVSSVGWLFDDYKTVLREAERTALASHNHPEAVRGAQCVASLIFELRTCHISREDTEAWVKKHFGYKIDTLENINKIGREGHFDGVCQETVPWAVRCFVESNSFEDAIRIAVMTRGDTDTKAAICGSIAEAYYSVPVPFVTKAASYLEPEMKNLLKECVERMLAKA
ncbi:MAG: ADP-ribosylglycohydrolase family protein [Prevotella sp.]|jgi:ADP-ribosyl-[dinitrogen reductase] hydrolase